MSISITTPTPQPTRIIGFFEQHFNEYSIYNWWLPFFELIIIAIVSILVTVFVYRKFIKGKIKRGSKREELLFKDFNVGEFKVIMMRKIGDKYNEIERIKMKINTQEGNSFKYNNKDFQTFHIKDIAFSDKKNNYYAFDYDTGEQLTFKTKGMPKKITIDDVDIYVNRKIVEQLVQGLEEAKNKGQWIMLIVGVVIGIAIGFIIGQQVTNYQNTPKLILGLFGVF